MDNLIEKAKKPLQKLIAFTDHEMDVIRSEIEQGWRIVSLVANGNRYVGVVEMMNNLDSDSIYIPPRKKIKIFG
ncbi:MAG: hypothetical protein RLZZ59_688 [Pseudomonadota bacterium]|jgi:hypothetical protein